MNRQRLLRRAPLYCLLGVNALIWTHFAVGFQSLTLAEVCAGSWLVFWGMLYANLTEHFLCSP
jgi:hypothetical protein